jgi:hypothetical protein
MFLQLSKYHHRWFCSTPNPASASPSIHRNVREQMLTRSSSIMIGYVGPGRLRSFINSQCINRLYIMIEELAREGSPPTISTRIWDSRTWYIWSKVHQLQAPQRSTPKKRRLDPIDSSTGSHQDEGNSGFFDLIDSPSDYLLDQLNFFLNQLILRWR